MQKDKRNLFSKEQVRTLRETAKNSDAFWEIVRKLLRKPQPSPNITLDHWQNYFASLLQTREIGGTPDATLNDGQMEDLEFCEVTDRPISREEIKEAIKHI